MTEPLTPLTPPMAAAVIVPLLVSAVVAIAARPVATALPPRLGVWTLTAATVVTSGSGVWSLGLLAASVADDLPDTPLYEGVPVDDTVAVIAAVLFLVAAGRVVAVLRRRRRLHLHLRPLLAASSGDLIVMPDDAPHAFAVAGRVVVTVAMLRALSVPQRRALLAHERAHIRSRHGTALTCVQLATAVNPSLVPVRDAVSFLCERDADEAAAEAIGDRRLVAESLAMAALASRPWPPTAGPAFQRHAIIRRIDALNAPPVAQLSTRRRASLTVATLVPALVLSAVVLLTSVEATQALWAVVAAALG